MDQINETKKETKKELFYKLEKLRIEVNSYNKDLNKVNDEKKSGFSQKKDLSSNIIIKIDGIRENRNKRDSLTKKVKELKEIRQKFNEDIRKKVTELLKLKSAVKNLTKKSKIKDPKRIKGEIDKIEVILETEAMSFDKEKIFSKKLKLLKKEYDEASIVIKISDGIKKLSLEINKNRKNSQDTHNEIQKLAKESQELHEGIIKNSKEIDGLKAKEGENYKIFIKSKKEFNKINYELKEKLAGMKSISEKLNKFKLEEDEKRELSESILIKNKEQEIEEKIKKGKKLTTDDFLAFQEIIKNKSSDTS